MTSSETPITLTAADVFGDLLRIPKPGSRELIPLTLHPAQQRVIDAWDRRGPDGLPVFDEYALLWPKRAGKSITDAGLALAELVGNVSEPDREVVLIASALAQSTDIVLQQAKRFCQRHPWLSQHCRPTKTEIIYREVVTDHTTGGRHTEEHVIRSVPANDAAHQHGRNHSLLVVDELHALMSHDILEALARPANRKAPRIVYSSYLGLKSQMRDGVPVWDLWQRLQAGDDPRLFASYLCGVEGYRDIPWVTPKFLESQRRQFVSVPSKFVRLFENRWATGDAGSFLTTAEIQDATDRAHIEPRTALSGISYALGLDLGLSRDLTGLVLSHTDTAGRLVVDLARSWRGTKQKPVDLRVVRETVLHLARTFQAPCHLDQWQGALLAQELTQKHIVCRTHTIESARLDNYSSLLKTLFLNRTIRIPPDVELLSQLETLEGEELARRDRARFTASGQNHDDLPMAVCLSCESHVQWSTTHGLLRLRSTRFGLPAMAEISYCEAARRHGCDEGDITCPIAGEGPTAIAGCLRCAAYQSVRVAYDAHLATGAEWLPLPTFATTRLQPCQWVRDRRFRAFASTL